MLAMSLGLLGGPQAYAQVQVTMTGTTITVVSEGKTEQVFHRGKKAARARTGGWTLTDDDGETYETGTFLGRTTGGSGSASPEQVILGSGYEGKTTGASGSPTPEQVILASGYEGAINILVTNYGAVVEYDADLQVDLIQFPSAEDPIYTFLLAILTETYDGRPLMDYFAMIEFPTMGMFDEPEHEPIKAPSPKAFPDDTYYKVDWGFEKSLFHRLTWHPALAQKQVKVSVIDSGVRAPFQTHEGLDGARIRHIEVAPSLGQNVPHALGLLTLLSDKGHDESGSIGLLGQWATAGCNDMPPALMAQMAPQIFSYSVGDASPSSYYVARAIRKSIAANVDVINLSLKLPYSVTVENAIQAALDAGIIVVAAGGNYAYGGSLNATFPASMPGVIAVGAGTSKRKFSSISAQHGIDIVAPGEKVVIGRTDGEWQYAAGTSYAAVYVTATAAFMRALNPTVSTEEVLSALQQTADKPKKTNGIGFLNAFDAVNAVLAPAERAKLNEASPVLNCNSEGKDDDDDDDDNDDDDDDDDDENDGRIISIAGATFDLQVAEQQREVPAQFTLDQNYPNPFNPTTTFGFVLPEASTVSLKVYDLLGQEVATVINGKLRAGQHTFVWDAADLPSGSYIYRMIAGDFTAMKTMVLIK